MSRRLALFLAVTFGISWSAWGFLLLLARGGALTYGQPRFMLLFMLGGLGPTIGAYVAVMGSSGQAPLSEFHARLVRWRVHVGWYVAALAIPVTTAVAVTFVAARIDPAVRGHLAFRPWYLFFPYFVLMIFGGGLEELGWRGVAQPELERTRGRSTAAVLVGSVWAIWHLPLFALPGVTQSHMFFPAFAVAVIGNALILAWLVGRTRSILLCVVFHAAWNAIAALGLVVPENDRVLTFMSGAFAVCVGYVLLRRDALNG